MKLSQNAANLLNDHRIEPFDGPLRRKFHAGQELILPNRLRMEAYSRHPQGYLMSLGAFSYVSSASRDTRKMRVGRYCSIARGIHVVSGNHPIDAVSTNPFFYGHYHSKQLPDVINRSENPVFSRDLGHVQIEHDVWIGGYCVLKGGIRIGTGSVIAAGSVVVKDVPPYTIMGGNPARPLRRRFDEDTVRMLLESEWWTVDPQCLRDFPMFDIPVFCKSLRELREDGQAKPFRPAVFTLEGSEILCSSR